ncbi:zinc ribbon domain-containing protein [Candidatus Woesearchaeota archaeon]|nr:zinc ribbon domain-containing protein [Candidatus Woesearchaeota archaeon]
MPIYTFTCGGCGHKYTSSNPSGPPRCPNCGAIIGSTLTEEGKLMRHTGRVTTEKFKDEAHKGILNWLFNSRDSSSEAGGGDKKYSSFPLGFFILLIFIAFFVWGVVVAPGLESGFWQSKVGSPMKSVLQGTRQLFTFMGNQFSNINKILKGENVFSFETGGAEIKKKTGLSFGGGSVFGGGGDLAVFGGYTNEEFGVNGDIVVGKLDEGIPELREIKLSCSVDENIKGRIEMDDINRVEDGAVVFDIHNPKPFDEARIPFSCSFDPSKNTALASTLLRKINTKTIRLSLSYPIEISSRLEIFALPEERYKEYRGRYDLAFDELHGGIYSARSSKILSKSKYESDVDVALWFDNQPLGASRDGKDYTLRFAFKNKNTGNRFKIGRFSIELPDGIRFNDAGCEKFENGVFRGEYFASVNNALNNEVAGEYFGSCRIMVDERILGGSNADIVKGGDVDAAMMYEYTITAERDVVLKQPEEEQIVADSENPIS